MKLLSLAVLSFVLVAGTASAEEGRIYLPRDGKSFPITGKDIVRFTGPSPGSTGYRTEVKVTEGSAKVVERAVYSVTNGMAPQTGGGALEFDVSPEAGKTGKVKVTVTTIAPGGKEEKKKEYEFEVK